MPVPEDDVRQKLIDLSIIASGSIFVGPVIAPGGSVPSKAIFVLQTPGRVPRSFHSSGNHRQAIVRIFVRGNDAESYIAGRDFAEDVWDALHRASLAGYIAVDAFEDRFEYAGQDAGSRHQWNANFLLNYES